MYLLFAGSEFDVQGGIGDLVGIYATLAGAEEAVREYSWEWAHVAVVTDRSIKALGLPDFSPMNDIFYELEAPPLRIQFERSMLHGVGRGGSMTRNMYLLFVGEGNWPDGGKWELTGAFRTLAAAQNAIGSESHTLIIGSKELELVARNRIQGGLINSSWWEEGLL